MSLYSKIQEKVYLRVINDFRSYFHAYIIYNWVKDKNKILNVGSGDGRDYFYLTLKGKKVVNVDIAEHKDYPYVKADVTRGLPFNDKEFDAVIIAEVLEHLFEDFIALKEIRRVLKDDGILIVTVPFYSDGAEYHVRIHSDKTIKRLLKYCGFQIEDFIYKGGLFITISPYGFNFILKNIRKFFGIDLYPLFIKLDIILSKTPIKILFRFSKYYGCLIKCKKGKQMDYRELNIREFGD
ncbi:class I SAM-dependent methyltransferase [Methanocaldococcus fervens]|uniref:Methyltransferase type 11 n=1 Tax=Methanocaldococcus fervens (strain DSM 4213 / JCM 15782 / AG86) TaxID=573064 RepID=C7P709_METFA|nr:class I SAM-dependent methyltransferase [Methanocaldococcus fervens]ACV24341.1 Methyltransferase type 11 [Methanocaldococcus fervens AG86]